MAFQNNNQCSTCRTPFQRGSLNPVCQNPSCSSASYVALPGAPQPQAMRMQPLNASHQVFCNPPCTGLTHPVCACVFPRVRDAKCMLCGQCVVGWAVSWMVPGAIPATPALMPWLQGIGTSIAGNLVGCCVGGKAHHAFERCTGKQWFAYNPENGCCCGRC